MDLNLLYANIIILLIGLFDTIVLSYDINEENGILVLNNNNFNEAIKLHDYLFVNFYDEYRQSYYFHPIYSRIVENMKSENSVIKFAQVDTSYESQLRHKYTHSYGPILILFRKGKPIDYNMDPLAEKIIPWLKMKISILDKLEDANMVRNFSNFDDVVLVAFLMDQQSPIISILEELATELHDFNFGICSDIKALTEFNVEKDTIVLFKKFDDKRVEMVPSINSSKNILKDFIIKNRYPFISEFTHRNYHIFSRQKEIKYFMILFVNSKSEYFYDYLELFEERILPDFRGELIFFYIDTDNSEYDQTLSYFGVELEETPIYIMGYFSEESNKITKFMPSTFDFKDDILKTFIRETIEGKQKPYYKSAKLPIDWNDKPVKTLVSKNYYEVVLDKNKHVLVDLYAKECESCIILEPIWLELGEMYTDNQDVIIAKIDARANDVENVKITSYPTIKLYLKESNEVLDFGGKQTLENIQRFLESGGKDGEKFIEKEEL